MPHTHYLTPTWPAPAFIKAYTTLRMDGHSQPPYAQFNLSASVGDDADAVRKNRQQLQAELNLAQAPTWLKQVHGTSVVAAHESLPPVPEADAIWTDQPNLPCAVLTADCLPIFLCDPKNRRVAAIHAGWRGLAAGVLDATLDIFGAPYCDYLVWLGPAIGPTVFEVGEEVRDLFRQADPAADLAFQSRGQGKYLADLYQLARQRLSRYGVQQVYGGEYCTLSDPARFYSYRRDGEGAGRMASLIWMI
jgi:YfiH family protein